MRQLLILLFTAYTSLVYPQSIQWTSYVVEVSSENDVKLYGKRELIGRPNVFPNHVMNGCSWSPKAGVNSAFVHVGFKSPQPIAQVAIAVNSMPNTISSVIAIDESGGSHQLDIRKIYPLGPEPKIVRIFLPLTDYRVKGIKINFNLYGHTKPLHVDAIGISSAETPIQADVNVTQSKLFTDPPRNAGILVNSACDELNPTISEDGSLLFFSRKNCDSNVEGKKRESGDIMMVSLGEEGWTKPRPINGKLNNVGNNEPAGLHSDKSTIYLYGQYFASAPFAQQGLSKSVFNGSDWGDPVVQNIENFYSLNSKENTYYVSPDGKMLLMSLDRREGLGNTDLYISFLMNENIWSSPIHLGSEVNSAGFEFAPWLSEDRQTLFFSSYGFAGYGASDIYMTRRLGDGWSSWSEPENLGPVINSTLFDGYFRLFNNGKSAIYTSSFNSSGFGDFYFLSGIEEVKKVEKRQNLTINIQTSDGKNVVARIKLLAGEIILIDTVTSSGRLGFIPSDISQAERLIVVANGYFVLDEDIDIVSWQAKNELAFTLKPIIVGSSFVLDHIYFEQNSFQLLPASREALGGLKELLDQNPKMIIQIAGHTETQGNKKYNLQLSENRAHEVKKYLTNAGIKSSRLKTKGFGGTQPRFADDNPESRQQNRRVEIMVLR